MTEPGEKYVLFGPPASGKSSLIRHIPMLLPKATAVDLERVTQRERLVFADELRRHTFRGPLFVAAADLHMRDFQQPFRMVLLLADSKEGYLRHVEARAARHEKPADQGEAVLYDQMLPLREHADFVIDHLAAADIPALATLVMQTIGLAPTG